jgi:hypothetical protein
MTYHNGDIYDVNLIIIRVLGINFKKKVTEFLLIKTKIDMKYLTQIRVIFLLIKKTAAEK